MISRILYFIWLVCLGLVDSTPNKNPSEQNLPAKSNEAYKLLPVRNRAEYDANALPGDNAQYMIGLAASESDPDRIYTGQDMGGVWVSNNGGRDWNNLRNRGLHSRYIIGLEVDPLNKNRLFVMAQARTDKVHNKYQGLYQSADGGINWKMVFARKELGAIRQTTRNIAFAPSSKNSRLGHATRWYAAFCDFSEDSSEADDGLSFSNDGGSSWTEVRKLPKDIFGDLITGIRVHPTDAEVVFMYGRKGLYRFAKATQPAGAFEKLSGQNGLPEGNILGNFYIDAQGKVLITAVAGKGIYKSTDGGLRWNLLYPWKEIQKCFVNEGYPDRIYATATRESGQQVRVSKDGGLSWITTVNSTPPPGEAGPWHTHILSEMAWVIPNPKNPDRAFAHGNAKHHQTDNGGETWYPANNYFNGSQHTGINHEQMFDVKNPDRFCLFMVDEGVKYTENRGQWYYERKADKKALGLNHTTCHGGAMHPDAASKIILVSMGRLTGELLRSENNGETWTKVRSGNKKRWFVGFDQQNSDYCYQWRERSTDAGKTWIELPMPAGTMISGMSYQDGRILYAMDVDGEQKNIYRSEDRGDTWKKVITTTWLLTSPSDRQYSMRIHPANHNIIYTSSPKGQISRWNLDLQPGKQRTDFDVFNGKPMEEGFYASRFAIDRRFPDVMYMMNQRDNTGNKLFRSQNGGATWENISEGFPNTGHGGLEVSPVTGEVFIAGGNGSRVRLPPYKTSKTAYELITFKNSYLDKPY